MSEPQSIISIGNFDGVHQGHRQIIQKVVSEAKAHGCISKVLTFEPHPVNVLRPNYNVGLLTTVEQKEEMIRSLGVDEVVFISFNRDFADIRARDFFLQYLLKPHNPKEIHVGYDFSFGRNREGNTELLKKYCKESGVKLVVHSPYRSNDHQGIISSSEIREALAEGNIEEANTLLGYEYFLGNNVVRGDGRGRTIGFPTANLAHPAKLIPRVGVYATKTAVDGVEHFSVTNVGKAPTFDVDRELKVETHLLDFDKDIYGNYVVVKFLKKIRDEVKFNSIEELVQQIQKDITKAREIHQ